jgi:crotonobetainyl-CoA:carnitine CoA-transferase CaiB-like acyl-CoA transferase
VSESAPPTAAVPSSPTVRDAALQGIRVIDLSSLLMGPSATQALGDMGADVIKVEPPAGDLLRGIGPARHPGMGALFLNTNRNKRSVVLDLKAAAGRQALLDLCRDADVLLYNLRPQAMVRLGLSYEALAAVNPRILYVGLFGYGQDGPYAAMPAYDDLIQGGTAIPWLAAAASGGEPAYVPTAIVDRGVGLIAVGIVCAALLHQQRSGLGQKIDIPMFEAMAAFVLGDHLGGRSFEPPLGPPGYARMLAPDRRPLPTRDGHLCLMPYSDRHWHELFAAAGRDEWLAGEPRFASIAGRTQHIAELYAEMARLLPTRTTAEWMQICLERDIPAMPMQTLDALIDDPHLAATGFFTTVEHPSEGTIRSMAAPGRWSATPPRLGRHAPRLGEHSAEVLAEAGYDAARIAQLAGQGVTVLLQASEPAARPAGPATQGR